MIRLVVQGEPIAKARPRFSKGHTYTPKKTQDYEKLIKETFIRSGQIMETGTLEATIKCYFKIPKSATKGKLLAMQHNVVRPTKRPDLDNIIKGILDGLNGQAYKDDSQIVQLTAAKYYSDMPRVEIMISEVSIT